MTNDIRRFDEGPLPDPVVRGLRDVLAPPGGERYWNGLESRIMAGIRHGAADLTWWAELDHWTRPALVAAAALILLAGVATFRSQEAERQVAYESIAAPAGLPNEAVVRPNMLGERESTLSFLITH